MFNWHCAIICSYKYDARIWDFWEEPYEVSKGIEETKVCSNTVVEDRTSMDEVSMAKRKQKTRRDPRLVEIYENIEGIFARKGSRSLWPKKPFKHKFEKGSSVFGVPKSGSVRLRKGDLVVRSRRGKPLWKFFEYK